MPQTNLVFGGSGFIGTHLTRRLTQAGEAVISVDRRPPRERLAGVDYRTADVRDLAALDIDWRVDRIYNLAAVHTTPGHPAHEYYDTNVNGALQITKLAERLAIQEIIFTSSISVYGPSEELMTEDSPPAPTSAYGYSKLLSEHVHEDWLRRDEQRHLIVARPAVVFGPGEGGNFARLAKLLAKGFFVYPGRRDTVKACIYIDDLLSAMAFARCSEGERLVLFNAAYPSRYTLEQIVEALIRNHFPRTRQFQLPSAVVTTAAAVLRPFAVTGFGIHPDRVKKLIRSTNIYPNWLERHQFDFPSSLDRIVARWKQDTNGTFV